MTSDGCDYRVDHFGPWRLMTDYGIDHLGQWRLMTVITEWMDHLGPLCLKTVFTKVDHLRPWRLMAVITVWTTLDHNVLWPCLLNVPHWAMTSDDFDCWGVDHHGPWRLMTDYGMDGPPRTMMSDDCDCGVDHLVSIRIMPVITEWTTMDHDVWWLQLHRGPHWTVTSSDRDYIGDPLDHDVWWSWLYMGSTIDYDVQWL